LKDTGEVYCRRSEGLKGRDLDQNFFKWVDGEMSKLSVSDIRDALKKLREGSDETKEEDELKASIGIKKALTESFQAEVCVMISQKLKLKTSIYRYVFSPFKKISSYPRKLEMIPKPIYKPRNTPLIKSDEAKPQILTQEEFVNLGKAMLSNPMKGKKKKSKKKKKLDRSYEKVVSLFDHDSEEKEEKL